MKQSAGMIILRKKEDDPMSSLKDKTVTMAHGAGGRQTSELIDQIFAAHLQIRI